MKKLILAGSAILISLTSFVNIDSSIPNQENSVQLSVAQQTHADGVMMKDGTMKLIKSGKVTPMTEEITMSNGTSVLTDGTIIKKDKTRMMMQEGQHMDMAGIITVMKDSKGQ